MTRCANNKYNWTRCKYEVVNSEVLLRRCLVQVHLETCNIAHPDSFEVYRCVLFNVPIRPETNLTFDVRRVVCLQANTG